MYVYILESWQRAGNVVRGMRMRVERFPVRLGTYMCASNVVPGMQMRIEKLSVRLEKLPVRQHC